MADDHARVAAAVDGVGIIRIHRNGLAALSAVAVAVYLDQICDIRRIPGLAPVLGAEHCRPGVAEVCAAAQGIDDIVVVGIQRHRVHAEKAPVCIRKERHQLFPFLGGWIVPVCAAHVRPGVDVVFSGNQTGNEAAAADGDG